MALQTIALGSAPNDGTGDDPRTAGGKINSMFAELYGRMDTPIAHGAAGDGSTDDTSAFQDCLDEATGVVDGLGATYKITSDLTRSAGNLHLRNMTIDLSAAPAGTVGLTFSGSLGTSILLTANRTRFSLSVPLASASGLAADDFLFLGSDALFESNTNTKVGEIQRILSISGSTANLIDAIYSTYNTSDNAYVKKISFLQNVTLENVHFIGAGDGTEAGGMDQYASRFIACRNVKVIDCTGIGLDYASMEFATCYDVTVRGGSYSKAHDSVDGASYGLMFTQGTHHYRVGETMFHDLRHGTTTGGTSAVNRHGTIIGTTHTGCRAAGIDNHAGSEIFTWTGNTVSAEVGNLSSGTQAAFQTLGGSGVISNNTVRGAFEHGVLAQIFPLNVATALSIDSNTLEHGSSTDSDHIGIFVENRSNTAAVSVGVNSNKLTDGWQVAVLIEADAADIKRVSVNSNTCGLVKSRGIHLRALTGRVIEHGTVNGNTVSVDSGGSEAIFLDSTDAGGIEFLAVTGNSTFGGTYGIRGVNTDRISYPGNVCVGASSANVAVAGANSSATGNVTA